MATFAMYVWTGPCAVREIAAKLREAGIAVSCEGTEQVFVNVEGRDPHGAGWDALVDVQRKHGKDFGLTFRPV